MRSKYLNNILFIIGLQFVITSLFAQKQYNVLNWKTDISLNAYLVQQMKMQYKERQIHLNNALKTSTTTNAYVQSVRQKIKNLLGNFPEKSELETQITGTIQREGYHIEKIVYQSFKNHHVTANLYVPSGSGKFPALLFFCGHEDTSKATESYQKTAILLAKNGFVVLVIDPISQSERVQLTDQQGKALTRGATTEHTLLNQSSSLFGASVAVYELFDNFRGLDYLVSRPEVDANRIGCMGNSGGGMQSIYFAAFDERIKVIVPCSYLASREHTFETTGAADGCAQIPNEGAMELEMADYLIAAAPKPVLVLAGRYDFIDYNGTLQSFADLEKVYKSLGSSNKLSLFTVDDGHGISKPKRERAVQWFRQWFYNDSKPVKEDDLTTLSDQELFASEKGKVNLSYPKEVNIADRNWSLLDQNQRSRLAFARLPIEQKRTQIQKLVGITSNVAPITTEQVGRVEANGLSLEKVILRKANEVPMPLLIHRPQQKAQKLVIWLSDGGKNKLVDSVALMKTYAEQNVVLILADVRGIGETADKPELNDPKYFNQEYRNAILALHIGKPLIGQRITDILNLIAMAEATPDWKGVPIEINTIGLIGTAALHATFLEPQKISKLNLYKDLMSYQQLLRQPLAKDRYGVVVPNMMNFYDLPELLHWIGTEKVKLHF